MQKITTFLTFKDQAEDALKFYTSVFRNAKAGETQRYGEGAPVPDPIAPALATLDRVLQRGRHVTEGNQRQAGHLNRAAR